MSDEKSQLHRLMEQDVALISNANCVLARLWRLTLYNLEVRAPIWEALLDNYILTCTSQIGEKKASNLKGNLPKGLAGDEVTWQRFCEGLSVFNFEDVIFTVTTVENGKETESSIHIPVIIKEIPGTLLRLLWDIINKAYPEKAGKQWGSLIDNYIEHCKKRDGQVPTFLKGNLKRALSEDTLMWNMFYRGLAIYAFEKIKIELKVKRRRRPYEVIRLNLS